MIVRVSSAGVDDDAGTVYGILFRDAEPQAPGLAYDPFVFYARPVGSGSTG